MVHLSGPSFSFLAVIFRFLDLNMISNSVILFGVIYILTIYRMDVNVIYRGPVSGNLMSCCVWMIGGVAGMACHSGVCDCVLSVLNGIISRCFCDGCAYTIVVLWSSLNAHHDSWSCNVCYI